MMHVGWLAVGCVLGMFNVTTQHWTVNRLQPQFPGRAIIWTVGGMFLRWLLVAGVLALALNYGLVSALLVVGGIWLARWIMLVWWLEIGV